MCVNRNRLYYGDVLAVRTEELRVLERMNITLSMASIAPGLVVSAATMITLLAYTSYGNDLSPEQVSNNHVSCWYEKFAIFDSALAYKVTVAVRKLLKNLASARRNLSKNQQQEMLLDCDHFDYSSCITFYILPKTKHELDLMTR